MSCNQSAGNKSDGTLSQKTEVSSDSLTISDTDVALEFINDYVDYCNKLEDEGDLVGWVNSNKLVTAEFKQELARLIDDANKKDPEWGLGADPILNGNDYPDTGYELKSFDPVSNLIYLKGKDWDMFEVTLRAKCIDGKWLVDGSGFVNMPQEDTVE